MEPLNSLFRMLIRQDESTLDNTLNSFDNLIRCSTDVVQSIKDAKVKVIDREVYIETLSIKVIHTSLSILTLAKGMKISSMKDKLNADIIDRSSIFLLTRSNIEAFLTLEYLFFNDLHEAEKDFRYLLWKVSGLMSRQMQEVIGPPPPNIPEEYKGVREKHLQQIADEKEIIEQLMTEIKASPYYEKLSGRCKGDLDRYGCPRTLSWNRLQELSILNTKFLKKMYKLSTNHAHSEYISAIQINEFSALAKDPNIVHATRLGITFSSIILSTILVLLKNRFKCAEIILNALPHDQYHEINQWYTFGVEGNFD